MPVNITDVDAFTDPVQAPDDGDSANGTTFQLAPQALANRTRNLKNRIDAQGQYAFYDVSNTAKASGSKFELTFSEGNGTFTLTSNEVEVPAAGTYLIYLIGEISSSQTANPSTPEALVKAGGIWGYVAWTRYSATAADRCAVSNTAVAIVTDPATQKVNVESAHSDTTLENAFIVIVRLV